MLILFTGKSRPCCKFLHGPPRRARYADSAHFETPQSYRKSGENRPFALT